MGIFEEMKIEELLGDDIGPGVAEVMCSLDSDKRIGFLQVVADIFSGAALGFMITEAKEHQGHGCGIEYPKENLLGFLDAVSQDLMISLESTCKLQNIKFDKDNPNADLTAELLKEIDDEQENESKD